MLPQAIHKQVEDYRDRVVNNRSKGRRKEPNICPSPEMAMRIHGALSSDNLPTLTCTSTTVSVASPLVTNAVSAATTTSTSVSNVGGGGEGGDGGADGVASEGGPAREGGANEGSQSKKGRRKRKRSSADLAASTEKEPRRKRLARCEREDSSQDAPMAATSSSSPSYGTMDDVSQQDNLLRLTERYMQQHYLKMLEPAFNQHQLSQCIPRSMSLVRIPVFLEQSRALVYQTPQLVQALAPTSAQVQQLVQADELAHLSQSTQTQGVPLAHQQLWQARQSALAQQVAHNQVSTQAITVAQSTPEVQTLGQDPLSSLGQSSPQTHRSVQTQTTLSGRTQQSVRTQGRASTQIQRVQPSEPLVQNQASTEAGATSSVPQALAQTQTVERGQLSPLAQSAQQLPETQILPQVNRSETSTPVQGVSLSHSIVQAQQLSCDHPLSQFQSTCVTYPTSSIAQAQEISSSRGVPDDPSLAQFQQQAQTHQFAQAQRLAQTHSSQSLSQSHEILPPPSVAQAPHLHSTQPSMQAHGVSLQSVANFAQGSPHQIQPFPLHPAGYSATQAQRLAGAELPSGVQPLNVRGFHSPPPLTSAPVYNTLHRSFPVTTTATLSAYGAQMRPMVYPAWGLPWLTQGHSSPILSSTAVPPAAYLQSPAIDHLACTTTSFPPPSYSSHISDVTSSVMQVPHTSTAPTSLPVDVSSSPVVSTASFPTVSFMPTSVHREVQEVDLSESSPVSPPRSQFQPYVFPKGPSYITLIKRFDTLAIPRRRLANTVSSVSSRGGIMSSFVQPHASLLAPECRQSRSIASSSGLASGSPTDCGHSTQGRLEPECNPEHGEEPDCNPEHGEEPECNPEDGGELECNPEHRAESECNPEHGGESQCDLENETLPECTFDYRPKSGCNTESEPQSTNSPIQFSSLRSSSPLSLDHPVGAAVSALLSLGDCTNSQSPGEYATTPFPRVSTSPLNQLNQSSTGQLQSESPLSQNPSHRASLMPISNVGSYAAETSGNTKVGATTVNVPCSLSTVVRSTSSLEKTIGTSNFSSGASSFSAMAEYTPSSAIDGNTSHSLAPAISANKLHSLAMVACTYLSQSTGTLSLSAGGTPSSSLANSESMLHCPTSIESSSITMAEGGSSVGGVSSMMATPSSTSISLTAAGGGSSNLAPAGGILDTPGSPTAPVIIRSSPNNQPEEQSSAAPSPTQWREMAYIGVMVVPDAVSSAGCLPSESDTIRLLGEPSVTLTKVDGPSLIGTEHMVDDHAAGSASFSRESSVEESNQPFSLQGETGAQELSQSTPSRSFSSRVQSPESGQEWVQERQRNTHKQPQRRATRRQTSPRKQNTRTLRSRCRTASSRNT